MNEKVNKKVQENMTLLLQKLGEANPNLNIDLADLSATTSINNADDTPLTGGSSF